MLSVTPAALKAIDDLTGDDAVGLRVGMSPCGSISLEVAAPQHDDTVVWSHRTVVFVDPAVASQVDHAVLDLRSTPGAAAFFLR